tara:strand:+ start:135 stop:344 length:210 start_codon:yes stop_codon:yes gene_type:complete
MNIEELKEEIENNFESYPHEVKDYIHHLEYKNIEFFNIILDIKTKLYKKEYIKAKTYLTNLIFKITNKT